VGQDVADAENIGIDLETNKIDIKTKVKSEDYNDGYGLGWKQISMMNGQFLHKAGYKGDGIYIAVLDAGFYRANRISAFDSLFQSKRFLGSKDLVDVGSDVFNDDDHGTHVLSCLASNANGVMTGTAPNASYLLIRTEDAGSETPAEEVQWLCGAEYADSMGIDLISSSLGYTEFDDKSFGHHYNELNGYTTLITRAANLAWERGIIIVNSAGNEGDGDWKYIGAPADAMGVIAVGAVDENGFKSDFSSFGPTADNRIKPDLVALGQRTTVINSNGYCIRSNGTSFSAPVLAGAVACLIQANIDKSPAQIRKILMLSSSQYLGPDSKTGHGLPDFELALAMSKPESFRSADNAIPFLNLPQDSIFTAFDLRSTLSPAKSYTYKLYNHKGGVEESGTIFKHEGLLYTIRITPKKKGKYTLEIADGAVKWTSGFYFEPHEN
jgi:serine protease AprX